MDPFAQSQSFVDNQEEDSSDFNKSFIGNNDGGGATPIKKKKNFFRDNKITPFLTSQLNFCDIQDSVTIIYQGTPVNNIILVGKIIDIEVTGNTNSYKIADGFGTTKVVYWTNTNIDADDFKSSETTVNEDMNSVSVGKYVKIIGKLIELDGNVVCNLLHIKTIKNFNEISYHLLYTMNAELFFQNGGRIVESAIFKDALDTSADLDTDTNMNLQGFDNLSKKIMGIIKKCHEDNGVHKEEINSAIQGHTMEEIEQKLDWLLNEGQVYTTDDDNRFMAVDASI
eukprot:GAHX01001391.1.p1 GENE.GAHX01001391.1~~GAHX01001391.1.p1  ORF type:complete len:283 (-),score=61.70 GAHX01001391.1:42-890(-)